MTLARFSLLNGELQQEKHKGRKRKTINYDPYDGHRESNSISSNIILTYLRDLRALRVELIFLDSIDISQLPRECPTMPHPTLDDGPVAFIREVHSGQLDKVGRCYHLHPESVAHGLDPVTSEATRHVALLTGLRATLSRFPRHSPPRSTGSVVIQHTGELAMPRYKVPVDDNFHYMDEDERWTAGTYETLEKALAECCRLVEVSLVDLFEPGISAEELYQYYTMFGFDPFIVPIEGDIPVAVDDVRAKFSAWKYAKERCRAICGSD
jgi:hypothetical protein